MHEVEYKARVDDVAALEARLAAGDARNLGDVDERDTYFSHPVRAFAKSDEALRVRVTHEGSKAPRKTITYKGPKASGPVRSRLEIELGIEGDTDALLQALGFRPAGRVAKHRKRFHWQGLTVTVDRVEGLGTFAEVEALVETKDAATAARTRVLEAAKMLGLGAEERRSYLELVLGKPSADS